MHISMLPVLFFITLIVHSPTVLAASTHICYFVNQFLVNPKPSEVIPVAAIFGYPKEKRLLLLDHLGMYHEVKGDAAIQLSGDQGLKIDLKGAQEGDITKRWPGLTSLAADDSEAIMYKDAPWFCLFNKTTSGQSGTCYSLNSANTMNFTEALLKDSTAGNFFSRFSQFQKCRRKSSLKATGEFVMTFLKKNTKAGSDLECPIEWRSTDDYNASMFVYEGVVLIINFHYAYAFHKSEVVENGNATVYRIPLKHLLACDPKMMQTRGNRIFGLSTMSFTVLLIGGLCGLLLIAEIVYIVGCLESSPSKPPKSQLKRRKRKPVRGEKRFSGSNDSVEIAPTQKMSASIKSQEDGVEATGETTAPSNSNGEFQSTGFPMYPASNSISGQSFDASTGAAYPIPASYQSVSVHPGAYGTASPNSGPGYSLDGYAAQPLEAYPMQASASYPPGVYPEQQPNQAAPPNYYNSNNTF